MADYNTYNLIKKFEARCEEMGFKISRTRWSNNDGTAYIELQPLDDNYPAFSRDCAITSGSIEYLMAFMDGMEKMKTYYQYLKLIDDKKVSRKEQDVRNRQLMRQLAE